MADVDEPARLVTLDGHDCVRVQCHRVPGTLDGSVDRVDEEGRVVDDDVDHGPVTVVAMGFLVRGEHPHRGRFRLPERHEVEDAPELGEQRLVGQCRHVLVRDAPDVSLGELG